MKVFKSSSKLCKKTDDYGKQILNYQVKREPFFNVSSLNETEKIFMFDSELFPFYDSSLNRTRLTKSSIENQLISNFVTDEVLKCVSKIDQTFVLHNFEINEAGVSGHHQIKSATSMLMLLLRIVHYTSHNSDEAFVTMDIEYNPDGTIDTINSKLRLWEIILKNNDQHVGKLIDHDYKFDSNIIMDFMSIELPTFHSAVNTEIMSKYFDKIQLSIRDRLLNYPNCSFDSFDLDSIDTPLIKDNKQCYNKFGYVNNTWNTFETINSENFFAYVQKVLDYNNIHFIKPLKNIIYSKDIIKDIEIKTFGPYGLVDIIKNYQQRDKYVLSYSSKLFNLLNGTYGSHSFNVTPDFIRLTELKTDVINELTPEYKYYAHHNGMLYVSYSELKRKKYHRHELENVIMYCINLNYTIDFKCFIQYFKHNNIAKCNESYVELTLENLTKMISIKLKPENIFYKLNHKISMIDYRIYMKLYK